MRIPTSTIVMGLVTCVPFALAIREGAPSRHVDDVEEDAEVMMAREAQLRAEAASERARAAEAQAEQLHQLYGTQPGTPGSLFHGIRLGAFEVTPEQVHQVHAISGAWVVLETDESGLFQIHIRPERERCDVFELKLTDTWGPGTPTGDGRVWLDPATNQRAVFDLDRGCNLFFDRYVPAERWIDRSPESIVPLWAIGQPAEKLTDALTRPAGDAKLPRVTWTGPGVGVGHDRTHLVAEIRHGRIVGISAEGAASPNTMVAIRDQITSLVGEPHKPKVPEGDVLIASDDTTRWDSKPPIVLDSSETGFHLSIGDVK